MDSKRDLRKFLGKKVRDTVTGVECLCTGCTNYFMGGDILLVEYPKKDGGYRQIWNPTDRYELLPEDQE